MPLRPPAIGPKTPGRGPGGKRVGTEMERGEVLEVLSATPERLAGLVAGLGGEELRWRPAPGKWAIQEIVLHLRDMEELAYLSRYRRLLAEDRPFLAALDPDRLARERDYLRQDVGRALDEFRDLRRQTLELLRSLPEEGWVRAGVHAEQGEITVRSLAEKQAVRNDLNHLGQVGRIRDLLEGGWPDALRRGEAFAVRPVGRVANGLSAKPVGGWERVESEIRLDPHLAAALVGIEGFSHLVVRYWFDREGAEGRRTLQVHPGGREDLPLTGVFACRCRHRPNPVGLTVVEFLGREGTALRVRGLDALDGTPVLDVKPYAPTLDAVPGARVPGWMEELAGNRHPPPAPAS